MVKDLSLLPSMWTRIRLLGPSAARRCGSRRRRTRLRLRSGWRRILPDRLRLLLYHQGWRWRRSMLHRRRVLPHGLWRRRRRGVLFRRWLSFKARAINLSLHRSGHVRGRLLSAPLGRYVYVSLAPYHTVSMVRTIVTFNVTFNHLRQPLHGHKARRWLLLRRHRTSAGWRGCCLHIVIVERASYTTRATLVVSVLRVLRPGSAAIESVMTMIARNPARRFWPMMVRVLRSSFPTSIERVVTVVSVTPARYPGPWRLPVPIIPTAAARHDSARRWSRRMEPRRRIHQPRRPMPSVPR